PNALLRAAHPESAQTRESQALPRFMLSAIAGTHKSKVLEAGQRLVACAPSCGQFSRKAPGGAWLRGRVIAFDLSTASLPFINSRAKARANRVARPALPEDTVTRAPAVSAANLQLTWSPWLRLIRKRRICQMDCSKPSFSGGNFRSQRSLRIMHTGDCV